MNKNKWKDRTYGEEMAPGLAENTQECARCYGDPLEEQQEGSLMPSQGREEIHSEKLTHSTSTLLKEPKKCELFSVSQRSLEEVVRVGLVAWDLGGGQRGLSRERWGSNRWLGITIYVTQEVTSPPKPQFPCLRPQSSWVIPVEANPGHCAGIPVGMLCVGVCFCFCSFVVKLNRRSTLLTDL